MLQTGVYVCVCVCVCQWKLTFHLCGLSFNKSRLPTDTVNWATLLSLKRALVYVKERTFSSVTTCTVLEFLMQKLWHDSQCSLNPFWVFAGILESRFSSSPTQKTCTWGNWELGVSGSVNSCLLCLLCGPAINWQLVGFVTQPCCCIFSDAHSYSIKPVALNQTLTGNPTDFRAQVCSSYMASGQQFSLDSHQIVTDISHAGQLFVHLTCLDPCSLKCVNASERPFLDIPVNPHPSVASNPVCSGLWWYFEVVGSSCLRLFLSVWVARPSLAIQQRPWGGLSLGLWRFRVTQVFVVSNYGTNTGGGFANALARQVFSQ